MTTNDTPRGSDGPDLLDTMGWITLPYGCAGLVRHVAVDDRRRVWSWLILIPWAKNDSKPWVDGTKIMSDAKLTVDQEEAAILQHMRDVLDARYGESVGQQATDNFIERLYRDE